MLAFTDVTLALKFFAAEVGVFLVYKILRGDFYWWMRVEGVLSVILSILVRGYSQGNHGLHWVRTLPKPTRDGRARVQREHALGANYALRSVGVVRGRE